MTRRITGVVLGFAVALACAGGALAHQTATNNGVTVTVHVAPDDEPIVGVVSVIGVTRVTTRPGRFAWATCRCTVEVRYAEGQVLRRGRAGPRTEFTFPAAGAYEIRVAGRVKRGKVWRWFKVAFVVRANDPA
jgi:hypothetical protein